MKIADFHERVWRGLSELRRQAYDIESARIVIHPTARAMLAMETDAFEWYRSPEGGERYRGLALELDSRIGEDSILLRYEVEA